MIIIIAIIIIKIIVIIKSSRHSVGSVQPSPTPLAERSKEWVCFRSVAGIARSDPAAAWMSVCCQCCVLSSRILCIGLIVVQKSHVVCLSVIVNPR
jgi:hypothetical protein